MRQFYNYCNSIINEAIPLKDAKRQKLSRKYSGAYNLNILNNVFGSEDRLIYDIDLKNSEVVKNNPIYEQIKYLLDMRYEIDITFDEYLEGIVYKSSDKDKKQPLKVGRLLTRLIEKYKDEEAGILLDSFKNDPARKTKKDTKYKVVISRHPYDLAGMSTDRNWTSCMNLGTSPIEYKDYSLRTTGTNSRYVKEDIRHGSIIAYLINGDELITDDKVKLRRPYSRLLMKPASSIDNKSDLVYTVGKMYGAKIDKFREFIENWLKENININTSGKKYYLRSGLYNDHESAVNFQMINSVHAVLEQVLRTNNINELPEIEFNVIQHQYTYDIVMDLYIKTKDNKFKSFEYESRDILPTYLRTVKNILKRYNIKNDQDTPIYFEYDDVSKILYIRAIVMNFFVPDVEDKEEEALEEYTYELIDSYLLDILSKLNSKDKINKLRTEINNVFADLDYEHLERNASAFP